MLIKKTVSHKSPAAFGTKTTAMTDTAQTSMAVFRAAPTENPRFRKYPDSHPPPIEPISADR